MTLAQLITLKTPKLGPVNNSTIYIYIYIYKHSTSFCNTRGHTPTSVSPAEEGRPMGSKELSHVGPPYNVVVLGRRNTSLAKGLFATKGSRVSREFWAAANVGVTNGGLRGVCAPLLKIGRNLPFFVFFAFARGPEQHLESPEIGGKRPFLRYPQISSRPHS